MIVTKEEKQKLSNLGVISAMSWQLRDGTHLKPFLEVLVSELGALQVAYN